MTFKRPSKLTVLLLVAIAFLTFVDVRQAIVIQQQKTVMRAIFKDLVVSYTLLKACMGQPDNTVLRAQRQIQIHNFR